MKDGPKKAAPSESRGYFQREVPAVNPEALDAARGSPPTLPAAGVMDESDEPFETVGVAKRAPRRAVEKPVAVPQPAPPPASTPAPAPAPAPASAATPAPSLGDFASRFERVQAEYLSLQSQLEANLKASAAKLHETEARAKSLEERLRKSEERAEHFGAMVRKQDEAIQSRESELARLREQGKLTQDKLLELMAIQKRLGEILQGD